MTEDEAIGILKTMCTDNFCIEQLKTKQAIETILAELEKKDKIINAMTKEWFELDTLFMIRGKNIHSEEELKQYFEKEVKDERKRKRSCGDDETLD